MTIKILRGYMVRICGNERVERILKKIRRYICDCDNKIECVANVSMKYITKEYDNVTLNQLSIKERIAKLIKENEKYFIYEVLRTTSDTILHPERLKTLGYSYRIAVEIFEKYGIFLYVSDLSCYIYAPRAVRYELYKLTEEYGLEKVAEEIAIYLKDKHSDKFGISIVSTQ